MKNRLLLVCSLIFVLCFNSCYSVRILAPHDQKVELATKAEQLGFKESQKNWYFLWGLVPINENSTDKIIKDNGLSKVRVETKTTIVDYLISFVLGSVSVVTNTTIVEGEAKKKSAKPSLFDN